MSWQKQQGFSLVELSIVLVIIGTIASSLVVPLSSSFRQNRYDRTNKQLLAIRDAMHGYLASTGKLPCPVKLSELDMVSGVEADVCTNSEGGVPAVALGVIGERDAQGALLDSWGHRLHYAVSLADHSEQGNHGYPDWVSEGELGLVGAQNLDADLQLCRSASNGKCAKRDLVADQIVWVIYSKGERDEAIGLQAENQDNDKTFVVSAYSNHSDHYFDDQMMWASRSELVYWLLKSNRLP